MSSLRMVLAAAGFASTAELVVLKESELGTLVSMEGRWLLISHPFDPDGSGMLKLRGVGPPPPALPERPSALIAELPETGVISLQSAEGMRALARELGHRLAPLTLIRLLVSQGTATGLPTLVEGNEQSTVLGPRQRERVGRLDPPVVELRPGGGWKAKFSTLTYLVAPSELLLIVVHDWEAEFSKQRGLVWTMIERGEPMPVGNCPGYG